jgi:hypothetical protein
MEMSKHARADVSCAARRLVAGALSISLSLGMVAVPRLVHADDAANKAEAKTRYDKGVKLYGEGAYEAALVEFQRAYDLNPSYKILYNIALIQQQLNDFVDALRNYQRYLDAGKTDIAPARRTEVEKAIAQMKQNVATLKINVNAEGADVTIDDVSVGKAPLTEAVMVNAGRRRISATKDKATATKVVVVAGGDEVTVDLEVVAPAVVVPPKPVGPKPSGAIDEGEPQPGASSGKRIPWVGWAITGGLAAGAVVTGIIALKSSSTLASERDVVGAPRSQLDDDQSKTKRWALVTDILAAGAIVVGGISLYLTLKSPSETKEKTTTTSAIDHVRVGVGPGSLILSGAF